MSKQDSAGNVSRNPTGAYSDAPRSYRESENSTSNFIGDEWSDQKSFELVADDSGNQHIVECANGKAGSIRPDHYYYDAATNTHYCIEDKNYGIEKKSGAENLASNIAKQAKSREDILGAEGANVKQTYVIDLQGHIKESGMTVVEFGKMKERTFEKMRELGVDTTKVRIVVQHGAYPNARSDLLW